MKINRFNIIFALLSIGGTIVFSGCEDNTQQLKQEEEQRYFDLFMASNYPELSPLESGLYIEVVEEGTGVLPASDDWLLINYVLTSIPSSRTTQKILDTYYENVAVEHSLYYTDVLYGPFKYQHGSEVAGLKEGIETIKEGGKSRLMFTSELGYGPSGTNVISPYTSLIYDVHLMEVIGDIEVWEQNRIVSYLDTVPESRITEIYDEETDATMYYIEDALGSGDSINTDTIVNVIYEGYLFDERVFDSNIDGDTLLVKVGADEVIRGWDIGLTYFMSGGKGRLVIPYPLAYGEPGKMNSSGKVIIPPYETLVFNMEVLNADVTEDDEKLE